MKYSIDDLIFDVFGRINNPTFGNSEGTLTLRIKMLALMVFWLVGCVIGGINNPGGFGGFLAGLLVGGAPLLLAARAGAFIDSTSSSSSGSDSNTDRGMGGAMGGSGCGSGCGGHGCH